MAAGTYNITIEQGATFRLSITWKADGVAVDITGYTARMQVRHRYSSTDTLLSLTSAAGDIVLGGSAGTIVVTASATATAAITERAAFYDLELVSGSGVVTRLLQGAVSITPEVTK
jgi:hypothetical protein